MRSRLGLCVGTLLLAVPAAAETSGKDLWTTHALPVLSKHCWKCHGEAKQRSGLDLRTPESILKGGERGPAVVPGKPEDSNLWTSLQVDGEPHMPPSHDEPLTDAERASVRSWIEALGAVAPVYAARAGDGPDAFVKAPRRAWTPADARSTIEAIDRYVERGWKARGVTPAPACDDAAFVRRVYLDVAGRIPTPAEAAAFVRDPRPDRRAALVDALLASDDYARRMRDVFDVVLMGRADAQAIARRQENGWYQYLERAFRENRPWDAIVRDLVVARPGRPEDRGAVWFLYERGDNHQLMAEAVAPVAYGVQIKCAQCHNHPVAREILQKHYWGLVTAFNRSRPVETEAGPALAESAIGGFISFANLKKESQPAVLAFPNGKTVPEPRPAADAREIDAPEKYLVPPAAAQAPADAPAKGKRGKRPARVAAAAVPKMSRRELLAEAIVRDNPLFARAFVNRLWALLLGRGLVHPVDEMDSKHPASDPDLLDYLAEQFDRGRDVKRLVRAIVLSRAYQLQSRPTSAPPEAFAAALEKPLSAEQLYRSMLVATGAAESNELRRRFVEEFPDLFAVEYGATWQQAMFLSTSPLVESLLKAAPTTARLSAVSDPAERAREAFRVAYGRAPDREERERAVAYLAARPDPAAGTRQLLWALLTSAEFQVNH